MLRFEWQIDRMEPGDRERLISLSARWFAIKEISYVPVLSRTLFFGQDLPHFNIARLNIVPSLRFVFYCLLRLSALFALLQIQALISSVVVGSHHDILCCFNLNPDNFCLRGRSLRLLRLCLLKQLWVTELCPG